MRGLYTLFTVALTTAAAWTAQTSQPATEPDLRFETVTLTEGGPPATLNLAYRTGTVARHPVILMLGGLDPQQLPAWSERLVEAGYMLCAFTVAHPPDPDPARRPAWLCFDQRFAHGFAVGGVRTPVDAGRVIDYLLTRGDVHAEKIGWFGSSSTGIPGLAVATREPRLAALLAFVSTGAYRQWFETWQPNGLWKGATPELWPETIELLRAHDPLLRADKMFPCAVLLVNGGEDQVVDPRTARAFMDAARPAYKSDPERLRLVVYEGFGHNLPLDVVRMYAEHWFQLYLHPTNAPPPPAATPVSLDDSVRRTQINAAEHKQVVGAD